MNRKLIALLPISVLALTLSACKNNEKQSTTEEPMEDVNVVLLCGQSNAEGSTSAANLQQYCTDTGKDKSIYVSGGEKCLISFYGEIGCNSSTGIYGDNSPYFTYAKCGQGWQPTHIGPELGFEEVINKNAQEKVYIIKYARSGGGLAKQAEWLPTSSGGVNNTYSRMLDYTRNCLDYLLVNNKRPTIKAFFWMQGETDAENTTHARDYETNTLNLIGDFRREFNNYGPDKCGDKIAFVDTDISNTGWPFFTLVNNAKRNVSQLSDYNYLIHTNGEIGGLNLTKNNERHGGGDGAHYNIDSMIELGNEYANLLLRNNIIK